ncbi:MAG: patatin-like phospholipase family protein [Bacteroidales bacterium]|jgi:NTE family protein|nr:patatin-like phospholipase family protein [Bacteroidales bacterium]HOI31229.1 patatin-like phospholipase family protein [Bacteroidales bacterium]
MRNSPKKYALALSGGGARGIFHAGFLQALDEARLRPAAISGASMGAIVGAFYASGVSPKEMLKAIKTPDILHIRSWIGFKGGLGSMKVLREQLTAFIHHNSFEALEIPLTVSVSNLNTGQNELLTTGDLIEAVVASASIPIVFMPVKIDSDYYLDGGLTLNLPAACLKAENTVVVGLDCNYFNQVDTSFTSFMPVVERCLHIAVQNTLRDQINSCDIYVNSPEMEDFGTFDFEQANTIFEIGYETASRFIPKIKEAIG